jgi:RNA polymerase sigma-70 factor (ECF subfamily)
VSNSAKFEQIVRDHQQMVFRTLARLLGPRIQQSRLEDLAQDVFLRLFRALPNFRGDAQITTYLYRIALNVAHDEATRSRRETRTHVSLSEPIPGTESDWESRLEHPGPSALAELEQDEFAYLVEAHLQTLSHTERSVLVLFHQEDQTYEQIAAALTMPINTVRTHLHRARKKLREALQPAPKAIPLSSKVKTA